MALGDRIKRETKKKSEQHRTKTASKDDEERRATCVERSSCDKTRTVAENEIAACVLVNPQQVTFNDEAQAQQPRSSGPKQLPGATRRKTVGRSKTTHETITHKELHTLVSLGAQPPPKSHRSRQNHVEPTQWRCHGNTHKRKCRNIISFSILSTSLSVCTENTNKIGQRGKLCDTLHNDSRRATSTKACSS